MPINIQRNILKFTDENKIFNFLQLKNFLIENQDMMFMLSHVNYFNSTHTNIYTYRAYM